jgi:hypothetical protein
MGRRRHWLDVDPAAIAIKFHVSINECEDGVIAPKTDIAAGMEFRAPLAKDDVSRDDGLAAKFLDAETFAGAVASIFDAALTFFMSHKPG